MIPCARGNGIQNDGNITVMPDRQRSFWIPVPASPCAHWNRIQNHDVIYCQSCRSTSDAHWICRGPLEESGRALFLDQICCAKGTETGHVIGRETQHNWRLKSDETARLIWTETQHGGKWRTVKVLSHDFTGPSFIRLSNVYKQCSLNAGIS